MIGTEEIMGRYLSIVALLAACGSKSGGAPDAGPDAVPDANQNAPICTITAPATTTKTAFDTAVAFTAAASDPQDGTLGGASIAWRSDLLAMPFGMGVTLSSTLPVGLNQVTCVATDSTSLTGASAAVVVKSVSPYAKINHPGNGETRPVNQAVPFVGVGRDLEDGTLSGASLVWTSSIDGALGTGGSFSKVLSAGTHTVTLTVTDSAANVDTDSITLTIQ